MTMAPFTIQQIRDAEAKYQETYQRVKERFQGKTAAEIVEMIPPTRQEDRVEILEKLRYVIAGNESGFYDLSKRLSSREKQAKASPVAVKKLSFFFGGELETHFYGRAKYDHYQKLNRAVLQFRPTPGVDLKEWERQRSRLSAEADRAEAQLKEKGNLNQKGCNPDIDHNYFSIYESESRFASSAKERGKILRELDVDRIHHLMLDAMKRLPIRYFDTLKGAAVFYRFADSFNREDSQYASLIKDGKLRIIEPAAGNVLSPLVLIARLMDKQQIQAAELTFTEINPDFIGAIDFQLRFLKSEGVITDYQLAPPKEFFTPEGKSDGIEYYFSFKYKGKEVKLTYALGRSGEDLWRKDQVEKGGLVAFLDLSSDSLGGYSKLFNKLKADRNPDAPLYLVTEGRRSKRSHTLGPVAGRLEYLPSTSYQEIKGPYGHCEQGGKLLYSTLIGNIIREVEYQQCSYSSAMVIPVR